MEVEMGKAKYNVLGGRRGGRTLEGQIREISRGNPGCEVFLCDLVVLPKGIEALNTIEELGLYGIDAYRLWNECCKRNTEEAAEILMLAKEGKITKEEIFEHLDLPFCRRFDIEEIRKREKRPQKMARKILVGRMESLNRTAEKMAVANAYRYLMEWMFVDPSDIGKTFTVEVRDVYEAGNRYIEAIKTEVQK